jgi:UDP-N-acetylglucosamine 2-epimerase (non-hydrolysing)/GDP/UDP-N,N'-diacetylbacillosamine 2-epimerase (hydrolysing)
MTSIAVVTVARSDFSIYRPVLRRLSDEPDYLLHLIAADTHFSPEYGVTVHDIEADGFKITEQVDMLEETDTPAGTAKSISRGVAGFSDIFTRLRPDILMVLGDRYEMLAAVVAALPFVIPVVHIHGGELSEGAFDEAIRHAITKMSHVHFVATETYARRVIQMGEEPWRVEVTGAPALDNLQEIDTPSAAEVERSFGISLSPAPLLVTFHPETLEQETTEEHFRELLSALDTCGEPVLFTYPNADPQGRRFIELIHEYVDGRPRRAQAVANLGLKGYYGVLREVPAMVGNSSSGIIEAASFGLPAVNVGNRQRGRLRGDNVIDTPARRDAITEALRRALDPAFRKTCHGLPNPYGDGNAAERIVGRLKALEPTEKLIIKKFHDLA